MNISILGLMVQLSQREGSLNKAFSIERFVLYISTKQSVGSVVPVTYTFLAPIIDSKSTKIQGQFIANYV